LTITTMRAFPALPDDAGPIGLVMLDTCFPRPPGDIGCAQTFRTPLRRHVVAGAWPRQVVSSAAALRAGGLVPRFQQAARQLADDGAQVILTSCGFLVLLQRELQDAVPVPVLSSGLLLLPGLLAAEAQVGALTIDAQALGDEYLIAAGVPPERLHDVLVQGVAPDSAFVRSILGNLPELDLGRARDALVAAAQALKARAPGLCTLLLECTNMPPYAADIERATGLRVVSLLDAPALQGRVAPGAWRAPDAR
jgi:aspartate/glutamate racemase